MQYREDRVSEALDAALEMTFPASDPIAISGYDEPISESSHGDGHEETRAAQNKTAR